MLARMRELSALADSLDERNEDNVSRTASYLELYAWARERGRELPWLLMAHLVSRNAGYWMTDLARRIETAPMPAMADALTNLFVLLERSNYLIFHDAWHHVCAHLAGRARELAPPRTPVFMCEAWRRYEDAIGERAPTADEERALVLDLVHNEQNLIERRSVHHPYLAQGLFAIGMIEQSGKERPLVFPWRETDTPVELRVGGFAELDKRIAAGARIFDAVLADRSRRAAMFEWAMAHPHTGSRAVAGGKDGPTLREAWPVVRVRALWSEVHAPPGVDPRYP